MGREDLIDSAELGISELVTNALLHGEPPIAVRMRGTHRHPRLEVLDGSRNPPVPNHRMTHEDELLATIGRGLGMVAMTSHAWGAELLEDGKIVWFEPAAEPVDDPDLDGELFAEVPLQIRDAPRVRIGDGVAIVYDALPIPAYLDWRRHFADLRRELRLLSLAHEDDYPVAKTLSDLFVSFGEAVKQTHGIDDILAAIKAGKSSTPVRLVTTPDAPPLVAQMIDVLELADSFCRAERLLSVAATPEQRDFQRWFLGEIVRQAEGNAPQPWPGTTTSGDRRALS